MSSIFISACNSSSWDVDAHISKYKNKLVEQPGNCEFAEQVGAGYGQKKNFITAIKYYKKALEYCPNNMTTIFDLGVLYYISGDKTEGLIHINRAIEIAKLNGDKAHMDIYLKEKEFWILSKEAKLEHLKKQK
jgi:tetratricopeptide (TPR) repeat protein